MAEHDDIIGFASVAGGSDHGGEVAFRGLGGRTVRALAYGGHGMRSLALDDRYVYWTDQRDNSVVRLPKGGRLCRVPKEGGSPERLVDRANDAKFAATFVSDFAVDDAFVYWATSDAPGAGGAIFRTAK